MNYALSIITTGLLLTLANSGIAQSDEIDVAVNELNGIYSGTYRFSVNSEKQLEVDFYNSSGHFRNDAVYLDYLDTTKVQYNEDEKAITIRCAAENEKCIDKEIFKLDVVRHSSRITIRESDTAQADSTMALFRKIIGLHLAREAELSETHGKR